MITEDYVGFEVAKLLKEKGFDGICGTAYEIITSEHAVEQSAISEWGKLCQVKRPTLQMAMKWLRSNFNLNPVPYALSLGWAFDVFDLSDRDITGCKKVYSMDFPTKNACYETYEEAAEAGIRYCLENLMP